MEQNELREKIIIRTSIVGIVTNIFLAAFKAIVGLAANSIAVVLDAVNNLSDVISSVVTIVGAKLANRPPDKDHPFGHGRTEYLSAMIVSAIILYAGGTAFIESVKKIIHPTKPEYSTVSLIIIGTAVVAKIILGTYVKKKGEKVNSGSLVASGKDALSDAILSLSVLISAIIFIITGFSLEPYVGVVIAIFIIRAGIEMFQESSDDIIGKSIDSKTIASLKAVANREPEVHGAYDVDLHNYGPDKFIGSLHVEVDDTLTAGQVDALIRRIQHNIHQEMGIIIESVTIYSINSNDDDIITMREEIRKIATGYEGITSIHGFYVDREHMTIRFDFVMKLDVEDKDKLQEEIYRTVADKYPEYKVVMSRDYDLS